MAKFEKHSEAILIYDKIHLYSIKYEESIFRKDYFMNYVQILISINNYLECIQVLSREIDFLMHSYKCQFEGIAVYILDLMLIYMITHNTQEIEAASEILEYYN